jgi:hypothetical protein
LIGDTIQFIRYANLLIERHAKVIIGCDPPLQRLMLNNFTRAQILDWHQPLPQFDLQCPLLDLPRLFQSSPGNWSDAIRGVIDALSQLVDSKR